MKHEPAYQHAAYLRKVIRVDQLAATVDLAVERLKEHADEFDAIAFRGMSGALIAPLLALKLDKTLIMVRKGEQNHSEYLVEGDMNARRYIIVDDCVCQYNTAKAIYHGIKKNSMHKDVECVAFYLYEMGGWDAHGVDKLKRCIKSDETMTKEEKQAILKKSKELQELFNEFKLIGFDPFMQFDSKECDFLEPILRELKNYREKS